MTQALAGGQTKGTEDLRLQMERIIQSQKLQSSVEEAWGWWEGQSKGEKDKDLRIVKTGKKTRIEELSKPGERQELKNCKKKHPLRPSLSRRYTVNEADLEQSYINTRYCAHEINTKDIWRRVFAALKKIRWYSSKVHLCCVRLYSIVLQFLL